MDASQRATTGATGNPLRVGVRVAIRYRLPAGSEASFTDVIGVVTAVDEVQVTVDAKNGPVTVARRDFVAARAVPPALVRRGRPHQAVGTADLERLMAEGWQAVEQAGLGDWLLRASSGFTRRANSVLPVGEPSLPLSSAVDHCERWYAARGLPAMFHLDLPASGLPANHMPANDMPTKDMPASGLPENDPLGRELLDRGYVVEQPTVTMTAASGDIPPLTSRSVPVTMDAAVSPFWLQAYAQQRSITPGVTEQVLTGSPAQLFASTTAPDGTITALARMSAHPGWAGIHALWVRPGARREGLGRTVVQAVAHLARQHRMGSLFLQVESDNDAALSFYQSLGFTTHHTYVYLVAGSDSHSD